MSILKKVNLVFKEKGLGYTLKRIVSKIVAQKIDNYSLIKELFKGKSGLEIGGPSGIFRSRGLISLYDVVKDLDGCNFSNSTIWEGTIEAGNTYRYKKNKTGHQYISEASDLSQVPRGKYDFVISSHCLEHVANPLKAMKEWLRVLKKDALLLIVVPNRKFTFDHNRPVTKFSHLLDDYKNDTAENDLTHFEEVMELHDLTMDKPAGSKSQFRERALDNFKTRSLHHHVFDIALLEEMYGFLGLEVILTYDKSQDMVILGKQGNVQV